MPRIRIEDHHDQLISSHDLVAEIRIHPMQLFGSKVRIPGQRLNAPLDALSALFNRVGRDSTHLKQELPSSSTGAVVTISASRSAADVAPLSISAASSDAVVAADITNSNGTPKHLKLKFHSSSKFNSQSHGHHPV